MPNAAITLDQGTRAVQAATTTDARALSDPTGTSRTAADYTDPNQVQVKLTFSQAYTGNIHLYSVDWDTTTRRELITVNGQTAQLSSDFSQGALGELPDHRGRGRSAHDHRRSHGRDERRPVGHLPRRGTGGGADRADQRARR